MKIKTMMTLLVGAAGGAAATYFLDPDRGNYRRSIATDQIQAAIRDGFDELSNRIDYAAGQAKGAMHESIDLTASPPEDDRTLKHKVESEVLGHVDVPSGHIDVSARDGIVELRGAVAQQSLMDELLRRTREVDGVRDVTSYLHLPGEPAPNVEPAYDAGS